MSIKRVSYSIANVILVLLLCIAVCGCNTCKHEYNVSNVKEATCVSVGNKTYTCSLCGASYSEEIPATGKHSYTSTVTKDATTSETGEKEYTCSICGKSYTEVIDKINSKWEIGHYVDDFGDETSDVYVIGTFTGVFSNSATTGSDLIVFIYLDKDEPSTTQIRLLEYGSYKASFLSSDTITLKTKDVSGYVNSYTLNYSDDLFSINSLDNAILNNGSLSCVITAESKYSSTNDTYKFTIDNVGLKELYDET